MCDQTLPLILPSAPKSGHIAWDTANGEEASTQKMRRGRLDLSDTSRKEVIGGIQGGGGEEKSWLPVFLFFLLQYRDHQPTELNERSNGAVVDRPISFSLHDIIIIHRFALLHFLKLFLKDFHVYIGWYNLYNLYFMLL